MKADGDRGAAQVKADEVKGVVWGGRGEGEGKGDGGREEEEIEVEKEAEA